MDKEYIKKEAYKWARNFSKDEKEVAAFIDGGEHVRRILESYSYSPSDKHFKDW